MRRVQRNVRCDKRVCRGERKCAHDHSEPGTVGGRDGDEEVLPGSDGGMRKERLRGTAQERRRKDDRKRG